MARIEVTMPKMGESIMEGTVVEWSKKIGDTVEQDETLLEIATDKVDSEVPAPESGVLVEILVEEGETVEVGEPIAIIETDADAAKDASQKGDSTGEAAEDVSEQDEQDEDPGEEAEASDDADDADERQKEDVRSEQDDEEEVSLKDAEKDKTSDGKSSQNGTGTSEKRSRHKEDDGKQVDSKTESKAGSRTGAAAGASGRQLDRSEEAETVAEGGSTPQRKGSDGRFFTPLVRAIAKEEGISQEELELLEGSGNQGRVTKQDVLDYVKSGKATKDRTGDAEDGAGLRKPGDAKSKQTIETEEIDPRWPDQKVEIIKMDRMRKVISNHMIRSKQTSAHVTTFGEADVTRLVQYRDKHKDKFQKENGFKLTFTPFFVEATIQAIREFPLINSSVDGDEIILKRSINYGIAVALGDVGTGGLIVPVIKNAGEMNIQGIARKTYELAQKARSKKLSPDDLVGGTFTLTNYGSVGNLMGTPIINQPQVAIFGTGIIQKRPVVIEVDGSDTIAIRHMVYLSMSYDHRIIDGAMGGAFVQRVKQYLENFDIDRTI